MRYTRLFLYTRREDPEDAVVASHKLMLRACMIRQLAKGLYTYLPLGYRVIKKIEKIVREEMDRAGAQEVLMPAVQPADLWIKSGRWFVYGKELLRFKDRDMRDCCLGPTHEEVVTDLVAREVKSYRQLPLNLYQIQTKFRDELRPRFGLMRAREFGMKDAYSFDADEEGAEKSYRTMFRAYERIFTRCGLKFRAVEADTGPIGGSFSHEFMVLADTGEDIMVSCDRCRYAANLERAEAVAEGPHPGEGEEPAPIEKVHTPGMKTVEDVCSYLGVEPARLIKTLIYMADGGPVAVLVRGDHELNETKLKNLLSADELAMASPQVIEEVTGGPLGFSGPVGLKNVPIYADNAVRWMTNAVAGANKEDYHIKGVNPGRDFEPRLYADLRLVRDGDRCPRCEGGRLRMSRGIEVGHVFKLGTKYSEKLGARFLDRDGRERPVVMGCYGIGIGRTAAAAIEQNHDEDGMIWPMPIAPFKVLVLPTNISDGSIAETGERIYRELKSAGIDVLIDDRDERPGTKFKDADLIGIPIRITVGEKGLSRGVVDIRLRATKEVREVPVERAVQETRELIEREMAKYEPMVDPEEREAS